MLFFLGLLFKHGPTFLIPKIDIQAPLEPSLSPVLSITESSPPHCQQSNFSYLASRESNRSFDNATTSPCPAVSYPRNSTVLDHWTAKLGHGLINEVGYPVFFVCGFKSRNTKWGGRYLLHAKASEGAIAHDALDILAKNHTILYKDGMLGAETVLNIPGEPYMEGSRAIIDFVFNLMVISPCEGLVYEADLYRIDE